jgi:predicted kinase
VHRENLAFLGEHPLLPERQAMSTLLAACGERLGEARGLLAERVSRGFCRHGHGDLHLANIVHVDGRPTAFDAIEFNDRMATIDVLYDLAFLLMDLWRHGLQREANVVLNRYLGVGADSVAALPGLRLLPLFLALRALIRLKAVVWKAEAAGREPTGEAVASDMATYAALAASALDARPAALLAIGGLSGTGKSSAAREVAPRIGVMPGAIVLRSDVERKALFGCAETAPLLAAAYTEAVTERVYGALLHKAAKALAAGYGVIIDAVSARPAQRAAIEAVATQAGVPFHGFWLTASQQVMLQRIEARCGDASDANRDVLLRQLDYDLGAMTWTRIDASSEIEATAHAICRAAGVAEAGI